MNRLDRLLFTSYIRAYFICLVSLLSLYVIVDLFTNLDEFAQKGGVLGLLKTAGGYYSLKLTQIFDRLCEAIVLLAAMFTVAWLQKNNELVPMLSAGVSTRRVLRPVLLGAAFFLGIGILNQEFVIPRIGSFLMLDRSQALDVKRKVEIEGAYDTNGVHVEGIQGDRASMTVEQFFVTVPDSLASGLLHLHATKAVYIPPGDEPLTGGFLLIDTKPTELPEGINSDVLTTIGPGKYFLATRSIDFAMLTRNRNWFSFASTTQLRELLDKGDPQRASAIAVLFHTRLTRPALGMILVILGLSVILRDQNRHVFISAGLCMAVCALFFAAVMVCKNLGESDWLSPTLAAWAPVLMFGPIAFSSYDAIHT